MKTQTLVKSAILLVCFCGSAHLLSAQQPDHPPGPPSKEMMEEHLKRMAAELQLSPEQSTRFMQIERDFFEQRKNLHEALAATGKRKMDELQAANETALKDVLNGDQLAEYKQKMEDLRKNHPHPGPPPEGHPPAPPAKN